MVRNVKCGLLKDLVVQVDLALVGLDVHRLRVGVVLLQLQDAGLVFRDQPIRTGVEVIFVYPVQGDNKVWLWASTGCSGAASALPLGFFGCCHGVNDLVYSVFAGKCDRIVLITSSAVMVKV